MHLDMCRLNGMHKNTENLIHIGDEIMNDISFSHNLVSMATPIVVHAEWRVHSHAHMLVDS